MAAFLATGMVASSNYVLNELLDARYDALHPVKKQLPVSSGRIAKPLAYAEWLFFPVSVRFRYLAGTS